jgi:Calx-beta domain
MNFPVRLWHSINRSWDALFALCEGSARVARTAVAGCLAPRKRKARRSDQSSVEVSVELLEKRWLMTAVSFSASTYSVNENAGTLTVTLTEDVAPASTISVNYATSDGSAHAGTDYTATGGTLTFNPGDTSKTFVVPIVNDGVPDGNETVILTLSGPTGGAALGSPTSAVLTLTDLPTSSVNPVPAATNTAGFTVSWSGSDNSGTGLASFDVFVSDNDGPFTRWQTGTTATSATFTGVDGHRYGFYSIARDNVGNVQTTPGGAQATTLVDLDPPASSVNALPPVTTATTFTVSWSGSDGAAGSGVASYEVFVSDNGGPFTAWLTSTTQTSATFNGVPGHTYAFSSVATDDAGNCEPTPAGAEAVITLQPPPPVARGIAARLVPVRVRKKTKLMVQVSFADTGALKSQFASPFQRPAFKNIGVSVRDGDADGVADQVVVTARKGKRTVTRIFPD